MVCQDRRRELIHFKLLLLIILGSSLLEVCYIWVPMYHNSPCWQSLYACQILAYLRKSLNELSKMFVEHAQYVAKI